MQIEGRFRRFCRIDRSNGGFRKCDNLKVEFFVTAAESVIVLVLRCAKRDKRRVCLQRKAQVRAAFSESLAACFAFRESIQRQTSYIRPSNRVSRAVKIFAFLQSLPEPTISFVCLCMAEKM